MSSYFDEMTRRVSVAEQARDSAMVKQLVEQAVERVRMYLDWIEKNALKSEQEKVSVLRAQFDQLLKKGAPWGASIFVGGDLHELGHDIGRARIRLSGGRSAGDNPYFPSHYDID